MHSVRARILYIIRTVSSVVCRNIPLTRALSTTSLDKGTFHAGTNTRVRDRHLGIRSWNTLEGHYLVTEQSLLVWCRHGGILYGIECNLQPHIVGIRGANTLEGLYSGVNMIPCHSTGSGDVGPVIFDRLPTWWFLTIEVFRSDS